MGLRYPAHIVNNPALALYPLRGVENTLRGIPNYLLSFLMQEPLGDTTNVSLVDNIAVPGAGVLASSAFGTPGDNPLDGAAVGTIPGAVGNGRIRFMKSYDPVTPSHTNIYSTELNDILNTATGTILLAARVANVGVWTDGAARYALRLQVDASNEIFFAKDAANNQMTIGYEAGGAPKSRAITGLSTTGIFVVALTWDTGADEVKVYLDGIQQGATLTGLGTWAGNLSTTKSVIGAFTTTPTFVWHGGIGYVPIYTHALTQPEIARIIRSMGVS